MLRLIALILLVFAAPSCPRRAAALGDRSEPPQAWPLFHGDVQRSGSSRHPAIRRPRIRWRTRVGIQSWLNAPALADRVVIVGSSGDVHNRPDPRDGVYALALADGRIVWHRRFDADANGVAVAGGLVVATSDDGHAYGLELRTGAIRWKVRGEGKMYTHPLVVSDLVVVGDAAGNLYGLSLGDGALRWRQQLSGAIRGGAAADDSYVYAVSQAGEMLAIETSGRVAWRRGLRRAAFDGSLTKVAAYAAPVVFEDRVVVPFVRDTTYPDPAVLAVEASTGDIAWRASGSGEWANIRASPALVSGMLIWAEAYSGDVVGLAARDGRMSYRRRVGPCLFPQWAAPVAAGGLVYLPRSDGVLYALWAENGEPAWRLYLGEAARAGPEPPSEIVRLSACAWKPPVGAPLYSSPAVGPGGLLLVGTGEGWLFAIEEAD